MSDVKWIKITTDIFDDEKILLIESLPEADSIIVIWFKLLCLAGKMNNSGVFMMSNRIAYTDKMLATIFRRKEATVQLALRTFEEFGMVELIDGVITIPNWEKHQSLDALEKMKEQNRERVKRCRDKQKLLASPSNINGNVTGNITGNVTGSDTVTFCNALDKNRIDKNRIDKSRLEKNVFCAEQSSDCSTPEPPAATLPLNDGSEYGITEADIENYHDLYPAVNIMQELRKMRGWCEANPKNRKTKNGIKRFINAWLAKEQDRGGSRGSQSKPSSGVDRLAEMYREEFG